MGKSQHIERHAATRRRPKRWLSALFVLGTMWMGGAEGALTGIIWQQASASRKPPVPPCDTPCRAPLGDVLRAGFIGVNGGAPYGADVPFGGYKASGVGRQNGYAGFDQYLEIKSVAWPAS